MRGRIAQKQARQGGYTLIEILVVVAIMGVVGTMLVGTWISLLRSFDFSDQKNNDATTVRVALDRITSEIQSAQPCAASTATPFVLSLASPYVCNADDCTFYTPYNNPNAVSGSGSSGEGAAMLTSIYLNTSGTQSQKTLMMVRDTNGDGVFDAGDQVMTLATNVVNTASNINRPIFTYVLDTNGTYSTTNSLTSTNVAYVVAVDMEICVDCNLNSLPVYVDLVSTACPRN
jgi:prepilin-type N-terminal cleavage/methylation domain-containing protein